MTTCNLANIFLTELYTALDYVDRAYFVILDLLPQLAQDKFIQQAARDAYDKALPLLPGLHLAAGQGPRPTTRRRRKTVTQAKANVAPPQLAPLSFSLAAEEPLEGKEATPEALWQKLKICGRIYLAYLELEPSPELNELVVQFINHLYGHAFALHTYLQQKAQINLEYPRSSLARTTPSLAEGGTKVVRFSLDAQVAQCLKEEDVAAYLLARQRAEKHQHYLRSAQRWLHLQRPLQAQEDLKKALALMVSAEGLTLLAQVTAQQGDLGQAQNLCQEAIKIDPAYGPSYNDLGVYLMNQGQLDSALRWLQAAKQALHYDHREFPFINCGKIYLAQHNLPAAYAEFQRALMLVPQDGEIQKMIRLAAEMLQPLRRNPRSMDSSPKPDDFTPPDTLN